MVMARILLVRHGQSEWNAEGRWQGQADIALSELGRAQAKAAVAQLGTFDVIAASTLIRASETAAIIAEGLGIGPVIAVPELIERSAGEWSGLTRDDIEKQFPGYLSANKRPPGYEHDPELSVRIEAGIETLSEFIGPDETALVVAHGGIIYVLEDSAGKNRGRISNLGAIWIELNVDGSFEIGERVELIGDEKLSSAQSSDIL